MNNATTLYINSKTKNNKNILFVVYITYKNIISFQIIVKLSCITSKIHDKTCYIFDLWDSICVFFNNLCKIYINTILNYCVDNHHFYRK